MHDDHIRVEIRGTEAEAVLLAAEGGGGQIPHSKVIAAVGGHEWAASDASATLRRLGLASEEQSLAHETTLTSQGRRVAQAVRRARHNGPDRWDAVERAIMADLIRNKRRSADDWGAASVDGQDVTDDERTNAMQRLAEWGYLTGIGGWQTSGFARIDATPKAAQVAGIIGLLADQHRSGGGSSYHYGDTTTLGNNNTVGVLQTGGHGNTQTVTQTIDVEERAQVLQLVRPLLAALDTADGDTTELRGAVQAITEEVVSDDATRASLKNRVVQALVVAGASESGHLITQGLAHLLGVVTG